MSCSHTWNNDIKNQRISILNEQINEICIEYNLGIIDCHSIFFENSLTSASYYHSDGLHLSSEGYEAWCTRGLLPFLESKTFNSIGMVGNSITARVEDFQWDSSYTTDSNWEYLLKSEVHNYGVGGERSDEVLKRVDSIIADSLDCYFLLVGINDISQQISPYIAANNIKRIVKRFQDADATIVLQTVMPVVEF